MNSRKLVFSFRDGDCFLSAGFVEKDSQFFPVFCCFGSESIRWLHVGTCVAGSQNSGMLVTSGILGNNLYGYLYC